MDSVKKEHFANSVVSLLEKNPTIKLFSITVKKECVIERMRTDSNKLYNYMIYLSLSDEMCRYDSIILVPDPRSLSDLGNRRENSTEREQISTILKVNSRSIDR